MLCTTGAAAAGADWVLGCGRRDQGSHWLAVVHRGCAVMAALQPQTLIAMAHMQRSACRGYGGSLQGLCGDWTELTATGPEEDTARLESPDRVPKALMAASLNLYHSRPAQPAERSVTLPD